MIEWVDRRLEEWAKQIAGVGMGAMGYPSQSLNFVRGTGQRGAIVPIATEVMVIDGIVTRLPDKFKIVVKEQYMQISTPDQKAARCGCSRRTFFRRLDKIHEHIESVISHERELIKAA